MGCTASHAVDNSNLRNGKFGLFSCPARNATNPENANVFRDLPRQPSLLAFPDGSQFGLKFELSMYWRVAPSLNSNLWLLPVSSMPGSGNQGRFGRISTDSGGVAGSWGMARLKAGWASEPKATASVLFTIGRLVARFSWTINDGKTTGRGKSIGFSNLIGFLCFYVTRFALATASSGVKREFYNYSNCPT